MLPMKRQEHAHSQSLCMMGRAVLDHFSFVCPVSSRPQKHCEDDQSRSQPDDQRGCCSLPGYSYPKDREHHPTPRRESQSAALTVLGTDNNVPSTVVKSLPQRDMPRRWLPHAAVLVQDGLRKVGGGGEADHLVGALVVVARVDGRAILAAHAGAPTPARLVAEGRLGRAVLSEVLDAVLDCALVDMMEVRDVAADNVGLVGKGRGMLVGGFVRVLLSECCCQERVVGDVGRGNQSTNQLALREEACRSCAQLEEEQKGEDQVVHREDVLVVLMMDGYGCVRRRGQDCKLK